MSAWRRYRVENLLIALALPLAACGPKPAATAPAAPPPAEVGVVKAEPASVGLVTELPGRTEASRIAQVRARVAGIVQRQLFREGSDVKAGQPLFRLDDAPYRATLASAQAALARAEANVMQTRAQAERYKPLAEANAISQQEYIAAQAAFKQAEADVASAKAAMQTAQINVGYAAVASPIAGRIGRALVTEGALVGQGEATQLAVVQQIDPLYVNFTQPAGEVMRLRAAIASGAYTSAGSAGSVAVTVLLEDGSVYPLRGKLLFSDLSVDPSSNQITLRAEVPNPKGALLPGLYVRVRLEQAQVPSGILLPQQAVQRGSAGDTVMVVGADGKVAARPVKVSLGQGRQWVVLDGLAAGEQVVVEGFQKIRPNAVVKPVPWQAAASGAAAPAAPAASAAASAPAAR
ncbi:MAG TPA: efflux RND transporter periplasmic adaptor subunit [Piscinibacter sp.]|jgi:membrane fusion protein (multidrug efflux system)|nr:efflux RND transporter periplasmic adaptor subunit [Piscinibacter sp.]HOY33706.1 efflux RND transporter periplasmic adaptor subunit [Piscinibacter sp.]HPG77153.1 efflux RND transporter periplasmic adaptor subunit [Piscinibacter sp.]HPM64731.1 efflux RND transporter periplasmic adaptor subunit [Piscinibacter sp.]